MKPKCSTASHAYLLSHLLAMLTRLPVCRGLAHQYEQKLVQLKREEELIREEHLLSSKEELLDDPASQTGVTRSESTPQLAAQAAAGAVMREAAASAIIDALQVCPLVELQCVFTGVELLT